MCIYCASAHICVCSCIHANSVCMCVCACMCVHVMYVSAMCNVHACVYVTMRACICSMFIHACMCMCVGLHVMHACMCTCVRVCMHACKCACMHACVHMCVDRDTVEWPDGLIWPWSPECAMSIEECAAWTDNLTGGLQGGGPPSGGSGRFISSHHPQRPGWLHTMLLGGTRHPGCLSEVRRLAGHLCRGSSVHGSTSTAG